MRRTRSYQDLSPEEKSRYDRLRALERRLRDDGGVRAKRCGSRADRRRKIKAASDAMLGLEKELYTYIDPEHDPNYRVWRGSATQPRNRTGS